MQQIVGVDVGGTFTDLILIDEQSGGVRISKVPSTPENQAFGVMSVEEGLKMIISFGMTNIESPDTLKNLKK